MKTVEEKHYFANRSDFRSEMDDWLADPDINRIWMTDRYWQKDDPKRFEVIIQWEENGYSLPDGRTS